ncbi:MAG: sigma-70 family RNA polymerase sigma factor [Deltaproteobacteria bacterium]|nr:sigma-70 family RNA polymerase sigma factor [Deltaproteobacteria bacterium]
MDKASFSSEGKSHSMNRNSGKKYSFSGNTSENLAIYLKEIRKIPLLTAEREREVAIRVQQEDKEAVDTMISSNLRLVVKIAKKYVNRGLPFLDVIEEGNIGLIKAVYKFDPSKGYRFSTYATWWIRQCIERAIVNQSRVVRLPVHISDEINKMLKTSRELVLVLNREPTVEELAQEMRTTPKQITKLSMLIKRTASLDNSMDQDSSSDFNYSLQDVLEDTSLNPPSFDIDIKDRKMEIGRWLDTLNDTEKSIIAMRFGLEKDDTMTLESIGKVFGVTRERIRQIEKAAIDKLRKYTMRCNISMSDVT